jgi:MerR family transcriptional regulator, redox-sensitive transcriptional activator SoxR
MAVLTISDVAEQAGVKPSAIRYYESIGLLPAPPRKAGRRQYDESILTRLQIIDIAKSFDFTLDEIKLFFEGVSEQSPPSDIWKAFATTKMNEIKEQIIRAQQLHFILKTGLSCKCLTLSDCKISNIPLPASQSA